MQIEKGLFLFFVMVLIVMALIMTNTTTVGLIGYAKEIVKGIWPIA